VNKMAKNNKMPAIRFSGYTDAWEQRKLSEVVIINPKTDLPDEFKYVDLESVVGTNLLGFQVIKKENAPSRAQRLASYGDVFYQTVRPYQRNNYLFENVDKDMVFSTGYAQLRSKLDSYFLLTLVQNDNFVKVVLDNCTGTSYPAINGSELGKIIVQIPSNEVEANQIGKVFRGIDKSITLHQRKLGKLKLTKTALLQKLFPQNGSKFPELRFQGFTDAWEQRKLGDLMEVTSVKRIHQADWTDSGIRFFRARDIVSSMNNEEIDNPVFISEDKYEEYSRVSGKVVEGDLLVTGVGTIGVPYLIKDTTPLYFKDGNIIWFKNNNTLNGRYFYYCFQNGHIQNQIYSASGKGTVGTYTIENGKKTSIFYPSLNEQIKIGNLLDTMTIMITLYQRKLEMLKNVKKGLLQKMFV
jgi:hypothetical protein